MNRIAVTGAAGSLAKKVIPLLIADPSIDSIVALDRRSVSSRSSKVQVVRADLLTDELIELFTDCDSIIHLADQHQGSDHKVAVTALDRVLTAASGVGCRHLVLLSSALVYGARNDNPVPITEEQPRRPIPDVNYAVIKSALEDRAERWQNEDIANSVGVLRPTATLSEDSTSWIAAELRKATAARSGMVDPAVQFLHHDDLASAVVMTATKSLKGIFNVAPDGWMSASVFRDLGGETKLGIGDTVALKYRELLERAGVKGMSGLATYATHPWVVANDKLRSVGWRPTFSSEEAYVAGTPTPLWQSVPPNKRQEVAMGAAAGTALVVAAVLWRLLVRALR